MADRRTFLLPWPRETTTHPDPSWRACLPGRRLPRQPLHRKRNRHRSHCRARGSEPAGHRPADNDQSRSVLAICGPVRAEPHQLRLFQTRFRSNPSKEYLMTSRLSGILTALTTPFTSDGPIDETTLRRVVDRSIDGGVDGVVACGSTGEFAALSNVERRQVVETVIDQTAGRVPVIAQTGAVSTAEAIELSKHAEAAGASVLMVVAPYYEPLTVEETVHYLKTVADAVTIPIMLYNLPVATGVNLTPELVGRLATEVDNIQYIKDTSADMVLAGQLIHNYGDVISTFVGWDSLLLAALTEGAAGVMSGSANVIPGHLVSIHRALQKGELDRARREWSQIFPLIDAITSVPYNSAVKAALDAIGFPVGSCRKPILELDPDTAATIAAAASALPALSAAK